MYSPLGPGDDVIGDSRDLVVVANRLPVEFDDESGGWAVAPGGLVAALAPVLAQRHATWFGWAGLAADTESPPPPPTWGRCDLREVDIPVERLEGYYSGMSNATLWPLYHDGIATPSFSRDHWSDYCAVNQVFADEVARDAPTGATIWIHDYQLQLVPRMIRAQRDDVRIGFFLHIPFPPAELFRTMPWRRQILTGLLGADLVGFQTQAATDNFVALCVRMLAAHNDGETVVDPVDGHHVTVGAFPIAIDPAPWEERAALPEIREQARQFRRDLGDPVHVLLGVDRLDYTKGIDVRLQAFGEMLDEGSLDPQRSVLVQIATPTREAVPGYQEIRQDVEREVGRINGTHSIVGNSPVHYLSQSFSVEGLSALYLAADVALITPLRDGMNLVAKEYVASRIDDTGAVVLSEFTGAADELLTAYQVNPYDVDAMKVAIAAAINDPVEDRRARMAAMRDAVKRYDVHRWSERFLRELELSQAAPADLPPTPDIGS